jgi:GNAT superfamily N-acetyltransferase
MTNSSLQVRPVGAPSELEAFLTFPWTIYRDDPLWVPPILSEHRERIQGGAIAQRGEVQAFIARRGGRTVGTILAAEDPPTNKNRKARECMFGYFEYLPDEAVASALVDSAAAWARARGLDTLFGPFNLDYENGYGVLVEGRDRPPALLCGHTPPYYLDFMERLGFTPARGDNLAFEIDIDPELPQLKRISRLADRLRKRGRYTVRGANLEDWEGEVDRVMHLLNRSLAHLPDFIGWQRGSLQQLLAPFRQFADPELIVFVEDQGQTVGWFPGLPNLNEALIHANGLRRPWDTLKLWWYMRQQPECLAVKSVLVLPEYWNRGVAILLIDELAKKAFAKGYKWADLSLTSADNPNTPTLAAHAGAKIYKRYRVYKRAV